MKIGFIGTGVMGSRMVKRFLEHGFQVTVYNRTEEKLKPLIELGAKKAENIRSLSTNCNIICSCLSMPQDSEAIYLGENGVIQYAKSGTICIDFATIGPKTSRKIYNHAKEKGIHYLDAPVSGGPEGVEQGTLSIMIGGDEKSLHDVMPILNAIGKNIEYLGLSGAGSIAKLINQYLVAVHTLAASEAMVAGTALGLNSEKLYSLLKNSYGYSRMLERHMENFVFDRNFEPGGAVKYVHKDVKLANELLVEAGIHEFLGQYAEKSFQAAMDKGLSDKDMSSLIQLLEEKTNVTVKR